MNDAELLKVIMRERDPHWQHDQASSSFTTYGTAEPMLSEEEKARVFLRERKNPR